MYSDQEQKTIQEFFTELTEEGYENFENLIHKFSITSETLRPFAKWSDKKYQRVCLAKNKDSELLLLCWSKGQTTPVHNHSGQECWVYFVDGKIIETQYDCENGREVTSVNLILPGEVSYLTDSIAYHRLENVSDGTAMSLHLYASPIKECQVFDKKKDEFVSRKLEYDYLCEAV